MAARKSKTREPWPALAFRPGEIPPALSPAAEQKLIAANKGYRVDEPRLQELKDWITVNIREPRRYDATTSRRRVELAELKQAIEGLCHALETLHPRSAAEVASFRVGGHLFAPAQLTKTLKDLGIACGFALREIPDAGGRPKEDRRDRLIVRVCEFVDSLEPTTRRGEAMLASLRAVDRHEESVKIICADVGLHLRGDVPRIVQKVLSKEPA